MSMNKNHASQIVETVLLLDKQQQLKLLLCWSKMNTRNVRNEVCINSFGLVLYN